MHWLVGNEPGLVWNQNGLIRFNLIVQGTSTDEEMQLDINHKCKRQ